MENVSFSKYNLRNILYIYIYILKKYKNENVQIWYTHTVSKKIEIFECHISKDSIFQDVPIYFLIFVEVSWPHQRQIKLVLGPGDGLKHQEIMKFGVSGF